MLVGVICQCGNSETIYRNTLRNRGKKNFMTAHIVQGKTSFEHWSHSLSDNLKQTFEFELLEQYIANRGRYVIAVGYNDKTLYWGDISDGVTGKARAEAVIDKFD